MFKFNSFTSSARSSATFLLKGIYNYKHYKPTYNTFYSQSISRAYISTSIKSFPYNKLPKFEAIVRQAEELRVSHRLDEILQLYNQFIDHYEIFNKRKGLSTGAQLDLMKVHFEKAMLNLEIAPREAITGFHKVIEIIDLYPRGQEKLLLTCYLNLGSAYFLNNNLFEALEAYREFLNRSVSLSDQEGLFRAYYSIALVMEKLGSSDNTDIIGNYQKAAEVALEVPIKYDVLTMQTYVSLHRKLAENNLNKEAEQIYGKIQEIMINLQKIDIAQHNEYYLLLGQAQLSEEKISEAIESFEKGFELKPDALDSELIIGMGDLVAIAHKLDNYQAYELALKFYESALYINKRKDNYQNSAEICRKIGSVYLKMQRDDKVIQYCNKGLIFVKQLQDAKERKNSKALLNVLLGYAYAESGDLKKAKKCILDALKHFENNAKIYFEDIGLSYQMVGGIESQLGNFESALDYYNKRLERELARTERNALNISQTYLGIAELYVSKADFSIAQENFEKALNAIEGKLESCHENYMVIHGSLGDLLLKQGKLTEAINSYKKMGSHLIQKYGKHHEYVAGTKEQVMKEFTHAGASEAELKEIEDIYI